MRSDDDLLDATDEVDEADAAAERAGARRHALWSLTVLVLLAVLVVAVTLFFSGTSHPQRGEHIQLGITTDAPTAAETTSPAATVSPSPHRSIGARHRTSKTHAPRPQTSAPVTTTAAVAPPAPPPSTRATTQPAAVSPCHGSAPCVVAGDGGVGPALTAARQARGATAAQITVAPAAQQCAVSGGARCVGHYALQTATAQSGRQAIAALGSSAENAWLFDPATTALQVGWAYLPGMHEYVLALIQQ